MEYEFPTSKQSSSLIDKILKESKRVAIVGLSPNPEKDSYKVAKYLQESGYKILPIYPKEDTILGEKVYRSLDEIEGDIDIVDIFRKPDAVEKIVDEAIKRGSIKYIWLQLGITNTEALKKAQEAKIGAVQDKCIKIEHRRIFS